MHSMLKYEVDKYVAADACPPPFPPPFPPPCPTTDSCLLALKVFGQCYQQDCLKPMDVDPVPGDNTIPIDSARLDEEFAISIPNNGSTETINPDDIIVLPNNVQSVSIVPGTFKICSIDNLSITPSIFNLDAGYWDVKIRYKFSYQLQLFDQSGVLIPVTLESGGEGEELEEFCAYNIYTKLITLYGGKFNGGTTDVVSYTTLFNPPALYEAGSPFVLVQARAVNFPPEIVTHVVNTETERRIDVVIGLYTIIKLFRLVELLVEGSECVIPKCERIVPGDPCSIFLQTDFPFNSFNPQ